ncbi:hypothetical protein ACC692_37865, partial [Rhizobium ruizarguesonis]
DELCAALAPLQCDLAAMEGFQLVSDIDLVPRKRKRTVLSSLLDQRRSLPKGGESSRKAPLPGNKN